MTLHHIGEILRVDRLLRRIMPQIGHHEQCPCLPVGFRFYRQEMGGGNGAGNGGRALGSVNGWRSPSATAPGTQQRRQRENDHDGELLGSRRQFLPAQTFWGRRCRTGGALSSSPDAAPPAPPPILPPTAGFLLPVPSGRMNLEETLNDSGAEWLNSLLRAPTVREGSSTCQHTLRRGGDPPCRPATRCTDGGEMQERE